ncbi:MAG: AMP-binding protein [Candidatus Omnitrophica bacterium]|nr:AMP-binding protein [Candidatus Omnitrophota bacterium]MBD3269460.1 AMP-binding protein [Candidatus Omnitrophota bacterium]
MDVKSLLTEQARKFGEKNALLFEEKEFTFLEVKDYSFKLANYLLSSGLKGGEKVAIYLPNIPEAVFAFLGTFSISAVVVPLDFMLTEEEVINFLNHSEAKMLIAHPKKGIDFSRVINSCSNLEKIITCGKNTAGYQLWDSVIKSSSSRLPSSSFRENSLSSIFYTSGSTGHPKGVMLDYSHLDNPPEVLNYYLKGSDRDVYLCAGVPFSHIGGLDYILMMIYFGATLVLMERFMPLEFLRNIEKHKVTIFCIVPAMYVAILSLKGYDKFELSSLRYAVVFGAPSSDILLRRFHKICPNATVLNGWGMTETAAPNTYSPSDENKLASIGNFGFNMEAKIIDEKGNSLAENQRGELLVRGKGVMRGYYKEEGLTRSALSEDGWLYTGDIALKDEEGLYYIVGRKKDMIKVAGEIVFSAEVEEKIQRYPQVKECAVIGVEDKLRGEVPKAYIVTKEDKDIDIQDLKSFLQTKLAHFKIPHYFEVLDELPKNRTGKIDKQVLKMNDVSPGGS